MSEEEKRSGDDRDILEIQEEELIKELQIPGIRNKTLRRFCFYYLAEHGGKHRLFPPEVNDLMSEAKEKGKKAFGVRNAELILQYSNRTARDYRLAMLYLHKVDELAAKWFNEVLLDNAIQKAKAQKWSQKDVSSLEKALADTKKKGRSVNRSAVPSETNAAIES